jgi:hypothetical protein
MGVHSLLQGSFTYFFIFLSGYSEKYFYTVGQGEVGMSL